MDLHLNGKIALVTGASSGIGAETARALAEEGALVLAMARRGALLEELAQSCAFCPGTVLPCPGDISRAEDVEQVLNRARQEWGRLDLLVNCAAVTAQQMDTRDQLELFRRVLEVDLFGIYQVCRRAAPLLAPGGSVVNFTSVAAYMTGVGQDNYMTAKAGIVGLTRSLAGELAPRNIRVNAVCPGFVDTPMTARAHGADRAAALEGNLLKRAGTPRELADVVLFLSSDRAGFLTGQVIHVNGGQYLS